jgi:hypothetical protein
VLAPMLFLFYINDLPKAVNNHSKPVLFVHDTSVIVSNSNKIQYVQFRSTDNLPSQVDISYKNIVNDTNTQFLDITMDSSLSWKNHIDGLVVKLRKACCAIRSLMPFVYDLLEKFP